MEEACDFRSWDELIPDALGLIFVNLSLEEILTVIPRVCKGWARAVLGPYCWQEIDIERWSQDCKPETLDRMLRLLLSRSSGSLRKLCVSNLPDDSTFSFIASHAQRLQTLSIPGSKITESIVENMATRLCTLTFLDISYCLNIGGRAIESIGIHCKNLTSLCRNWHPLELIVDERLTQDDEALAIAATMPKLKHLEMAYLHINMESVITVLENCHDLEYLDLRGCWELNLDEKLLKKFSGLKLVGPHMDCYEASGWGNCSDYSGTSSYLAWDFVAGEMDDYDDDISDESWEYYGLADPGTDWPLSP